MDDNRIMIVDDNKAFLDELEETLSLCGYEPIAVPDSQAALKTAQKTNPDAIILDLKMDRMNGFQLAEALKNEKKTLAIPIIAMSGYFPIDGNSNLLDLSKMAGHIKKPFSIADLITELEKVLN